MNNLICDDRVDTEKLAAYIDGLSDEEFEAFASKAKYQKSFTKINHQVGDSEVVFSCQNIETRTRSMYQIFNGDCLAELQNIPDASIDMVLTDPPYSSGGLFAGNRKQDTRTKYCSKEHEGAARFQNFSGDNMDQRSFTAFCREVFAQVRSKVKEGGILGAFIDWRNLPAMADAVQMAGFIWLGIVVWDKRTSRPTPELFRNDCEYLVWGSNGSRPAPMVKGCKVAAGCYSVPGVQSKDKHHQTEKPVPLLEQLLQLVPDGGAVLDPFMGSGSTGVACMNMGLDFYGIELDPGYFKTSQKRIEEAEF